MQKGFGFADEFKTAIKKYGIWPTTVWDCNYNDPLLQQLKKRVGDGCEERAELDFPREGSFNAGKGHGDKAEIGKGYKPKNKSSARAGCFTKKSDDKSKLYAGKISESIFNPVVAIWILNLFGPEKGTVFDPFAGGGCRAIAVAKKGLEYVGIELRQEEVNAIKDRLNRNDCEAKIYCADSKNLKALKGGGIKNNSADFLITCPPYYNLETYKGGENDISMAKTYDEFLKGIKETVKESKRILKPGALSCWVVGLHRDKDGGLLSIHSDIAAIHKSLGFLHKEEVVLNLKNTGAIRRAGNFEKGDKRLIRTHEYLEVFVNTK